MKSTLICIFSFLSFNLLIAQTSEPNGASLPGGEQKESTGSGASKNEADVKYLQKDLEAKAKRVESKYFVEKEIFNSYNSTYSTTTVAVKKRIYSASEVLIAHYNKQLEELPASAYSDKYAVLKKIDQVYDRMILLAKEDNTRKLEKKLKKLDDPAKIKPVFFGEE